MKKISIIHVEDREVMRDTIKLLMQQQADIEIIAQAEDGEQGLQLLLENDADVVLMDINMPFMDGFKLAEKIIALKPQTKILVYTMHNNEYHVSKLLQTGVMGYMLKEDSFQDLVHAIRDVYTGKKVLSKRLSFSFFVKERSLLHTIPLRMA